MNAKRKLEESNLGLAILHARTPFGTVRTMREIAAWGGITYGGVFMIEQRALQKLRRQLHLRNDPMLRELCHSLFNL